MCFYISDRSCGQPTVTEKVQIPVYLGVFRPLEDSVGTKIDCDQLNLSLPSKSVHSNKQNESIYIYILFNIDI